NKGTLSKFPASLVDELMGQLRFLRAWNYFQVVRMFGPVPLLTDEHADNYFNLLPSRAPVAEVYGLIESDFQAAIAELPETWPANMGGRPTKDAARGLLAKAYVTMATAPLNDVSYY